MGYRAIAIDPDPNAYAKDSADLFFEVAGNDYLTTVRFAEYYKIKALVTTATDNPLIMMAQVAEKLGLTFPSERSIDTVLDKGKFKELLNEIGVQHAKGAVYQTSQQPDLTKHEFPVIIKPNNNSGSRGVVKCNTKEELNNAVKTIERFCKDGKYIVEEYIEGDEISVEGLVVKGKLEIVQITDKILSSPPYSVEMAHIQPSKYWNRKEEIGRLIQRVIDASGLDNCAIHPELRIRGNRIYLIELGPRLGGDYITSDLVPLSTGVNVEQEMVKLALGEEINLERFNMCSMIQYLALPERAIIKPGLDEVLKKEARASAKYKLYFDDNAEIKPVTDSSNRHGWWILQGITREQIMKKSNEILKKISYFVEE